jgi:hypothetical protein
LLSGNTVRPVLQEESSGFLASSLGWAVAIEVEIQRHSATRATRIVKTSDIPIYRTPLRGDGSLIALEQVPHGAVADTTPG